MSGSSCQWSISERHGNKMAGRGKAFEREISASLRHLKEHRLTSLFYHRLLDHHSPNAIRTPADFIVVEESTPYLLECKSCSSKTSFPFRLIRKSQLEDLIKASLAEIHCYFLIQKNIPRNKEVYAVRIENMSTSIKESSKSSIKWEDLAKISKRIERDENVWNLVPILCENPYGYDSEY